MNTTIQKTITHYAETYQKRYNREPRKIESLDNGWLIVNDAKMTVAELELLTLNIQREMLLDAKLNTRSTLMKLIRWIKQ